jgi:octaprenyl-diphosphate synthase
MAASCRAGGRLSGLSEGQQKALESFGRHVGVAFQIVDDLLDLEGEESVTGKTLHTDLDHGKMTLPLIHYLSRIKLPVERTALYQNLKNPNGKVPDLIKKLRDSGSMDYCRNKVQSLLRQAEDALAVLPDHSSRRLLSDIARRLADRNV